MFYEIVSIETLDGKQILEKQIKQLNKIFRKKLQILVNFSTEKVSQKLNTEKRRKTRSFQMQPRNYKTWFLILQKKLFWVAETFLFQSFKRVFLFQLKWFLNI